jgi:Uncharacterized proteins of the AP superfamily
MISLDATDDTDVDFLMELPCFSSLCRQGTLVREVNSVLVSNTYVVHSSIITGTYPFRHGITENLLTQPGKKHPDWHWNAADVHAPALYNKAADAGLSVCSIFYPVTCGARIRWNFPEVPGELSLFRRAVKLFAGGSPGFILSSLFHGAKQLHHLTEPYLDNFTTKVACRAIRQKEPDLLLLHLIDVDDHKHRFGPGSPQVKDALRRLDARLNQLLDAATRTWKNDDICFLIFSDHGCLKVNEAADPNDWLKMAGLIRGDGRQPEEYDAFFHNAGGTTFLKLLNPAKRAVVLQILSDFLNHPSAGRRLSEKEMQLSGMAGSFLCGIEAADGYCFGEAVRGQHGYGLQRKGYHPFYLAAGAGIVPGRVIKGGSVMDLCPLAADLLGIPLWEMDGTDKVMEGVKP